MPKERAGSGSEQDLLSKQTRIRQQEERAIEMYSSRPLKWEKNMN